MNRDIKLNSNEKKEQIILRSFLLFIAVIIFKGIYNQNCGIDQDYILWPLFLTVAGLFCLIYSINAFTTGNLVKRWASDYIFKFLFTLLKRNKLRTDDEASKLTTRLFGIFTLIISISLFVTEIIWFYLNFK